MTSNSSFFFYRFFSSRCSRTRSSNRNRSSSANAPLFFEIFYEIGNFQHSLCRKPLDNLFFCYVRHIRSIIKVSVKNDI